MIGQQVDFINVKHAAIGLGQHAGRELRTAVAQRGVKVESADQAFFGGAKRQRNELTACQQVREAASQG
ncbi:hypothetical protein D3C81_2024740 [compost metagenome]